ncbi:chlorophyll synthesis pathway protein BchC [Phreatobacter sp.]|uniref:chlorophyll synthesis pathway protein BchC n=1 Tax=Phreatobacter sp. TaxID=1966341 RepID=UPI003F70F29B
MKTLAVILREPHHLHLDRVELVPLTETDVIVDVMWSGISSGTERLLWSGRMPAFPGLGYPLVPGYETVGQIIDAGRQASHRIGERVFVPGSRGFRDVRGLFGGAARRLVVPAARAYPVDAALGEKAVLLALAATACRALSIGGRPDLVIGHGVLGRLIARVAMAEGGAPPVVWETRSERRTGSTGYTVIDPATDTRCDYARITDASGDSELLDTLIARLARGGEVVLAGFYERPLTFAFPPAFMREAAIRIASEFRDEDLTRASALVAAGTLSLDDLITRRFAPQDAGEAYRTAFEDPACLKALISWRSLP